jgi:hypothetical protein
MGGAFAGFLRPARLFLILLIGLFIPMLLLPRRAIADEIDGSIQQLRGSRAYKVRLSAAMFLAKQRDPRAILALARAVTHDPESTVRRVAALSLARLVDRVIAQEARNAAMTALQSASRSDRDRQVRRSAQLALERMHVALADSSSSASRIFVHVGVPPDPSRALPSDGSIALLAALRGSLREHAPDYEMASGVLPTRAELASRKLRGFTITARVARVSVEEKGNHTDVSCTVAVRVGPWTGRDGNESIAADVSASATGNGRVTASRRGARRATVDCAVAVAQELAARQVVPFLRRLAAAAP